MTQEERTMRKIRALVGKLNVRQVAMAAGLSRQSVYRVLRDGPRGRQGRYPSFLVLAELVDTWEAENGPLL